MLTENRSRMGDPETDDGAIEAMAAYLSVVEDVDAAFWALVGGDEDEVVRRLVLIRKRARAVIDEVKGVKNERTDERNE